MKPIQGSMFGEGINLLNVWRSLSSEQIKARPISVNVLITDRCNSKCVTCDIWENGAGGKDIADMHFFERISTELRELGVRRVALSGGEPLLRKDLEGIVHTFKSKGFYVQLTTHGLHAEERRLSSLWQAGVSCITFSLDHHTPEGYAKIRGVDWFEKVIDHIRLAVRLKPPETRVETNTVLSLENLSDFVQTLEFAVSLGIDGANFSPVVTHADNNLIHHEKKNLMPTSADFRSVIERVLELKQKKSEIVPSKAFIEGIPTYLENPSKISFPCYAGYVSLDIYTNGDVRGCGSMPVIGNVNRQPIAQIWKSVEAQENRKKMAKGQCPGCYVSCKIEPSLLVNPKTSLGVAANRIF